MTVIFENLYFQVEKSAEMFQVWIETEERVGRGENKKYSNYCLASIFDLFPWFDCLEIVRKVVNNDRFEESESDFVNEWVEWNQDLIWIQVVLRKVGVNMKPWLCIQLLESDRFNVFRSFKFKTLHFFTSEHTSIIQHSRVKYQMTRSTLSVNREITTFILSMNVESQKCLNYKFRVRKGWGFRMKGLEIVSI